MLELSVSLLYFAAFAGCLTLLACVLGGACAAGNADDWADRVLAESEQPASLRSDVFEPMLPAPWDDPLFECGGGDA